MCLPLYSGLFAPKSAEPFRLVNVRANADFQSPLQPSKASHFEMDAGPSYASIIGIYNGLAINSDNRFRRPLESRSRPFPLWEFHCTSLDPEKLDAVPEPKTLALAGLGIIAVMLLFRRRRA
jgi:hypothetical protein